MADDGVNGGVNGGVNDGLDLLDLDAIGYELFTIKKTVPVLDPETDEPMLDPATQQYQMEPRRWDLHDDVPAELMVRLFVLMRREERQLTTTATTAADVPDQDTRDTLDSLEESLQAAEDRALATLARKDGVVTRVCLDIFRHTYPATREKQLRQWFSAGEREVIAMRFFGHRGMLFSPAQPPTPSTTPTQTPPAAAETRLTPPLAPADKPKQPSRPAATRSSGASRSQSQKPTAAKAATATAPKATRRSARAAD